MSWPFANDNFSSVMSSRRFELILKFIHLNDYDHGYWIPHFLGAGMKNYAHEAANLIANIKADFPTHIAYIATHNRTVNMQGKKEKGNLLISLLSIITCKDRYMYMYMYMYTITTLYVNLCISHYMYIYTYISERT